MSSTKYLDEFMLDDKGQVTKDVMDTIKDYCGLFAFVMTICGHDEFSNHEKKALINNIIESSLKFMGRRYQANLSLYKKQVTANLQAGKLFETLSEIPAKMQEDYEIGIEDARHFLFAEVQDILKILKTDLEL